MTLKDLLEELTKEFLGQGELKEQRVLEDLVGFHLGFSWSELQLKKDFQVGVGEIRRIKANVERLVLGVPVAYITNQQEFFKSTFYVDERVLIPRPETEILVEKALELMSPSDLVVDIGAGSGCIGLSIAKEAPKSRILLVDASHEALEVTAKNQQVLGVSNIELVTCRVGEESHPRLDALSDVDLIVANPPYIEEGDGRVQKSVHDHEPHQALYATGDGLYWIESWLDWAHQRLKPGGFYIFEFGKDQEDEILPLVKKDQWKSRQTIQDFSGSPRFFLLKK